MKRISIGTWAYTIGPYKDKPVPFEEVVPKLRDLKFDGLELGAFNPHPNPDNTPTKEGRQKVLHMVKEAGLEFSGIAADLWSQKLIIGKRRISMLPQCSITQDRGHYFGSIRAPPTISRRRSRHGPQRGSRPEAVREEDVQRNHLLGFAPGFAS